MIKKRSNDSKYCNLQNLMTMNNFKFNISSKVFLIILGILVAIIIGFNSNAIGINGAKNFHNSSKINIDKSTKNLFETSSCKTY